MDIVVGIFFEDLEIKFIGVVVVDFDVDGCEEVYIIFFL